MLNSISSGIVTSELVLLWGRQMDMVSLRTGGSSLPAFSPVQWHWWPPRQKGSFERCTDLLHGLLSKSWSLSIWTLLETIFGWRVMLQRTLGACVWCGCACRQVLCREGEKDRHHLPWKPFVRIHISSVPSSFFHTSWTFWGFRAWEDPGHAEHAAALLSVVSLELPGYFSLL